MKHLRLIALGTVAALSLSVLAACGGGKTPASGGDLSAIEPDVSVSVPDASVEQPDVSSPAPDVSEGKTEEVTIALNKTDFTLKTAGAAYRLKATVTGTDSAKLVWTSSDEAVATVDENGTVTAVAAGTAVITATVEGLDLTARCTVRCTIKTEEKPAEPAPEDKPEETPAEPAPEVKPDEPADHTRRYVDALNNSGCELLQYNQIYTAQSPDAAQALEYVGLTPDVVSSFAVSFSMVNTKAFGLAAVMPAPGRQQAVTDGLNSYVARVQQIFERYLPDQYEIAKAAKLVTLSDGTVVLAMCEGQDAVLANIKAALG